MVFGINRRIADNKAIKDSERKQQQQAEQEKIEQEERRERRLLEEERKKQEHAREQEQQLDRDRQYNKAICLLGQLINKHSRTLVTKYQQTRIKDDYGNYDTSKFDSEIGYFYEKVFLVKIYENGIDLSYPPIEIERFSFHFHEIFQDILNAYSANDKLCLTGVFEDPLEFERSCADILIEQGWDARTTKGSGDQGVDVIAETEGLKFVLQCKMYSNPVGNKAVQEIYAGKQHEMANFAAVVTNSTYTKSAKELASTCGVLLLHVNDLSDINGKLTSHLESVTGQVGSDAEVSYLSELTYNIGLIEKHIADCGYVMERFETEGIEMLRAYVDNIPIFNFLISSIGIKISTMNYQVGEILSDKNKLYTGLNDLNNQFNFARAVADKNGGVTAHLFYFGDYEEERFTSFLKCAEVERDNFLKFQFDES